MDATVTAADASVIAVGASATVADALAIAVAKWSAARASATVASATETAAYVEEIESKSVTEIGMCGGAETAGNVTATASVRSCDAAATEERVDATVIESEATGREAATWRAGRRPAGPGRAACRPSRRPAVAARTAPSRPRAAVSPALQPAASLAAAEAVRSVLSLEYDLLVVFALGRLAATLLGQSSAESSVDRRHPVQSVGYESVSAVAEYWHSGAPVAWAG